MRKDLTAANAAPEKKMPVLTELVAELGYASVDDLRETLAVAAETARLRRLDALDEAASRAKIEALAPYQKVLQEQVARGGLVDAILDDLRLRISAGEAVVLPPLKELQALLTAPK